MYKRRKPKREFHAFISSVDRPNNKQIRQEWSKGNKNMTDALCGFKAALVYMGF
jgi:hypothetical protein